MIRRNSELKSEYAIYIVITVILALGASFLGRNSVIAVVITAVTLILVRLVADIRRYRRIADLSDSIDKILHGAEDVKFEEYQEGEVAILSSEIHKMVIRLREQASQLLADKRFLSDSIADIAHQLRTPLTSMNIIVDMFSDAELSDEKRFDLLAEMMQSLNRIEWLINTLLKMSKIDADTVFFEQKEYSVKDMLRKASQPLEVPLDINGVALKVNVPEDAVIRGDMIRPGRYPARVRALLQRKSCPEYQHRYRPCADKNDRRKTKWNHPREQPHGAGSRCGVYCKVLPYEEVKIWNY